MTQRTKLAPLLLFMVATAHAQRVGFSGNTCPESCNDLVRPVCGTNNRAYRNECHLQLAACNSNIRKKNDGPCVASGGSGGGGSSGGSSSGGRGTSGGESSSCDRRCSTSYQPVCATNGVTFDNRCKLSIARCQNSNIKERYEGVCPEPPNRSSGGSSSSGARPSGSASSSGSRPSSGSASRPPLSTGTGGSTSGSRPSSGNTLIGRPVQPIITALRPQASAPVVNPQSAPTSCERECTPGFRPVCGSDNQVYGNDCLLQIAICKNPTQLRKQNDGVCARDCSMNCPLEVSYVCGSDGKTYINDCDLIVAQCKDPSVRKVSNGACEGFRNPGCQIQNCERLATPVCGSDGRTYENVCMLRNRACFDTTLLRLHDGECVGQRCRQSCNLISEPVCGTDGVTYPNHCFLISEACRARSNVVKAYDGSC